MLRQVYGGVPGPKYVYVAEYWPPYRETGRYTPYVYANKPKKMEGVRWVKVPVRTNVPESEYEV